VVRFLTITDHYIKKIKILTDKTMKIVQVSIQISLTLLNNLDSIQIYHLIQQLWVKIYKKKVQIVLIMQLINLI
jgi:hypothetical protein